MRKEIRLNKYLSLCGVCSRREADRLIEQGRVSVNGKRALRGQTVTDSDEIRLNGEILREQEKRAVLAFYKPTGVTCTERVPYQW